ncbi:hypothetical protein Verru16b_00377 [Lacunisphaera limnophila]|uniref:Methylamine utilisation protein MauE domain-containing protein n=1 Tax=Lacunisphaera limnophila TaxID=1838286 RepID=A0A1D8AR20_9BACT|nr:MauE/DoxX family redox-associated membrane protein [Lacunisphaera limnophila]AOS43334.1 hypothetical protein Verru16b_00377 [Lacunisphaera limnophila]
MQLPPYKAPHPTGPARRLPDTLHLLKIQLRDYVPLLALLAVTVLAASAKDASYGPDGRPLRWMHDFMGFFLLVFALLKLFDLPGFADGFQKYDLLAKHSRRYALAYPFIELALGLGYLSFWRPPTVYLATMIVLGFGALGVITALARGLDLKCACMGSALKVPLSTVALVEDIAMFAMAAGLWLRLH